MQRKLLTFSVILILLFSHLAVLQLGFVSTVKAQEPSGSFGNPSLPLFQNLTLYVLYGNGTLDTNAVWNEIDWVNVERVGVHNQFGVGGFERQYGSIVYYPYSEVDNKTYDRPLWHVFLRFWAKVGGTWYKQYITIETAKTPNFFEVQPLSGNVTGEWEIGWNGTVVYQTKSFPVYVGLRVNRDSPYMSIKTNVTTPLALEDHAIEYELYLNPYWKGYVEKNVEYVRVEFLNGTNRDFNITQVMDCTNEVPDMVKTFSFLNLYKNVTINTFDFSDVFGGNGTKLAKIESVTLPNGMSTYIVKVGATFGSLAAGQKLVIDPTFGYASIGTAGIKSIENIIVGSVFTITENGTADSITFALKTTTSYIGYVKCAIYKHSDLSLVGETAEGDVVLDSTARWYGPFVFFGTKPSLIENTDYILMAWGVSNIGTAFMVYNVGATDQGHYMTARYDGFPNPLVTPTHTTNKFSIYCNYTVPAPDTKAPTYSNVGTNTTLAGQPCLFYTKWTDETGLATTGGFIFGTNNTGTSANETWTAFTANPDWSNKTKTLNTTVGIRVEWTIWANDTSNNWNNTGIQYLITISGKAWHGVSTWTSSLVTRTWSSGTSWTYNFATMAWQNISWIFYLGASIWKDIAAWSLSLITGLWQSITTWSFSLLSGIWNDVATWVFYPLTRLWSDIAVWAYSETTMMWNSIATYTLNLLTMAWHDLTWLFTLLPALPQWLNVAIWTFHMAPAEWVFPFVWIVMLGFIALCCLTFLDRPQRKRENV